jgi:hypothetical protein
MTPHEEAQRAAFHKAICQQVLWKGHDLQRFQAAFLTAGILLLDHGTPYVGADDVPETFHAKTETVRAEDSGRTVEAPANQGLSGTAIHTLKAAGIIQRFFGTIEKEHILYGERLSKRATRNGAHVRLWSLTSRPMAAEWLRNHGYTVPGAPQPQRELLFA